MDGTQSIRFFNRGPSPAARLAFFSALSLLLMFLDARYQYLESTRSVLSVIVSPIQRLATLPSTLVQQASEFFVVQGQLIDDNQLLQRQHQHDAAQLSQLQALQQENLRLRALLNLPKPDNFSLQTVEVVYAEPDVFKRKILVNKGTDMQIEPGQIVMDERGIVGQVTRVYPWLSEVTLITEKNHAVPVQVLRSGLRTIVFGAGDTSQLALRYIPASADIKQGDILVTSGVDGIYPANIPVARIKTIERDPTLPFAHVTSLPVAGVDQHRHLLILSTLPKRPSRPTGQPENSSHKGIRQ
jgi:rod shape-determining protein MreC